MLRASHLPAMSWHRAGISLVDIAQQTSQSDHVRVALQFFRVRAQFIAYELLSRSASQDRFDPGSHIQERAEIDAGVATKSL